MSPSDEELASLPELPRDDGGPVFAAPWQAHAFALVVQLHARGVFTWREWTRALGAALQAHPAEAADRYYERWVCALERLLRERGITDLATLTARTRAFAEARERAAHPRGG